MKISKIKRYNYKFGDGSSLPSKKGQLKIQEMAFVLVAVVFLGAMLFLFFAQFQQRLITEQAAEVREQRAYAMLDAIAGMPEFGCSGLDVLVCADEGKLEAFNGSTSAGAALQDSYAPFWESTSVSKIIIQEMYPGNKSYTLYDDGKSHKSVVTKSTYIPLCRSTYLQTECSIARIKIYTILP